MSQSKAYTSPGVYDYGSVESVTNQLDKIGSAEDGVMDADLDGEIVEDVN